MMRFAAIIGALFMVVGCGGGDAIQQSEQDVARGAAKMVINAAVERQFPQLNASLVTDCIIDNAELDEVLTISRDVVTSPSADTIKLVSDIANRPGTVQCFADKGTELLAK